MTLPASRRAALSGWGRYPVQECQVFRPEREDELRSILARGEQPSYIARGLGRSYGDPAMNREAGVILQERRNCFLDFDPATGILECEAGVSFAGIVEHFLPRGFFLPVTPGTKFVTLGGAIASDVHGKNHHRDGTLARFLLDFRLLIPGGEVLTCSPAQNPGIFWATVGGMGLTGIILSARLRLMPVPSAGVTVDYQKTHNLDEALERMEESDADYQYSVAWLDCLAQGASLGRCVLMRGNHAPAAETLHPQDPFRLPAKLALSVPVDLPSVLLNHLTVGAFNSCYYRWHRDSARRVVDLETFFYPLDAIHNWNRLYGRRGFVQYQVALPPECSRQGLIALLERLARARLGSFLSVLKRFGRANEGLLSFPIPGHTLTFDLPVNRELIPFLQETDELVLRYGGRTYLAKDAVLKPETFAAMYPRLPEFQNVRQRLDPEGVLSSSMSRRLGITPVCLRS